MSPSNLLIVTKIPSAVLSPNSRKHWRVKHAASKSIKKTTVVAVRIALDLLEDAPEELPWHDIELQAVFYHPMKRRRDPDNLVALLKYPIDALVISGLLVDDDKVTLKPVIQYIDKDSPRLELLVTRLPRLPHSS